MRARSRSKSRPGRRWGGGRQGRREPRRRRWPPAEEGAGEEEEVGVHADKGGGNQAGGQASGLGGWRQAGDIMEW